LIRNIIISFTALALIVLGVDIFIRNIISRKADIGDAPKQYGIATHYKPDIGPYFGEKRGDDDSDGFEDSTSFAIQDNIIGSNDEDAFLIDSTDSISKIINKPFFVPEVHVDNQLYTLEIPIKSAVVGDPVRGWIDFNGNEKFDKEEKAFTEYKSGNTVTLNWQVPTNINTSLSYLRIRTCEKVYKEDIEFADGAVTTGEVEDYPIRIIKSVIPSTELKETLDLASLMGTSGLESTNEIMQKLKLGSKFLNISVTGSKPSFIAINNIHEPSLTGLRVGHEADNKIAKSKPIVITIKSDVSLENLHFKLIDIDAGDRVKIEGFLKGTPVVFAVNNLTDNFFQQFNSIDNEVFSTADVDAGSNKLIPSALDMAVNVSFLNLVDSVKLSYSDGGDYSGSITLGDINIRKFSSPPVNIQNFKIEEVDENVDLFWKIDKNTNVAAYAIERSYDGKSYEIIGNSGKEGGQLSSYTYVDRTLLPVIQDCFYRIKIIERDNHISYSQTLRLKRKGSLGLTGVKPSGSYFTSSVDLILLVDMMGDIKVNMYDYQGEKVCSANFKDKLKGDLISINDQAKLPPNSYYIEVINRGNKYLVQVQKNERTAPGTIVL
jgi:GEVED domain